MDKLIITDNGGEPHTLDDLKFLYDALSNAILGLGSAFKAPGAYAIILSGCTTTVVGANTVWAAGYVLRNGEVFFMPGGAVASSAPDFYFNFDEQNDPNGLKTYEDFSTHQAYKIRQATITGINSGDVVNLDDTQDINSVFARMVCDNQYAQLFANPFTWQTAPLNADWSVGINCRYRKTRGQEVVLSGLVINTSVTLLNQTIFQLPAGFRPVQTLSFMGYAFDSATRFSVPVIIETSGNVSTNYSGGSALILSLDSVRFFID